MPFKSRAQAGAAFGGHLGPEMKKKAHKWAKETPNMEKLPQHVKEAQLKEAALANNVYFWMVVNPESAGANPEDLVYPGDEQGKQGMDPFTFGRIVLGGLQPSQVHGFYLSKEEALNAANQKVQEVNQAAKTLEEKKGMVTEKIEKVIKELQKEVNRCMEEGNDQEAQMYLEKITALREKHRMVEASKKPIEEKQDAKKK